MYLAGMTVGGREEPPPAVADTPDLLLRGEVGTVRVEELGWPGRCRGRRSGGPCRGFRPQSIRDGECGEDADGGHNEPGQGHPSPHAPERYKGVSSGWRSSKGSSGKETRPSGDRQARVLWAPSDGPASDRRPRAQMAPAPSEPRATTFSSRDPVVHRPFGLFAAAADLLVPAQVARQRAPDPRAARTDRGSRESVEAGAVTLRPLPPLRLGTTSSARASVAAAPDCGRAYDRQLSKQKRARRARNSARPGRRREQRRGSVTGTAAASVERPRISQVHHIVRLEDGGAEFDLSEPRARSASAVTASSTGGIGGRRPQRCRSHWR